MLPRYHGAVKYGGTAEKGTSGGVERGFLGSCELQHLCSSHK